MARTIAVQIDSIGARGDGVGRLPDGRRVFVPGTLPGETVSVGLGEARDDGVVGKLDEVIEASQERVKPPCVHFYTCGGCVLQHINDASYSAFKMDQVRTALERNNLVDIPVSGPHVSPPGSRRRATMAVFRASNKVVMGFNEFRSRRIVDQQECPILKPRLSSLVPGLRSVLANVLQPGQGMDVSMVEADGGVDMVLRPWVRKKKETHLPMAVLEALSQFAEAADVARLSWQNSADDDTDLTPVAWRKPFTVNFSGAIVTPPPGAFLQATKEGEAVLVSSVLEVLPKKSKVADLYAGCGTFTFALSAAGHKVHAVEGFTPALDALNAAMPGKAITAEKRDLARDPLMAKELKGFDAVVLDPPRLGANDQAKMLARSEVPLVVYVSCSPVSFAKDAAVLTGGGYRLESVNVVDQFLWSPHAELVGVFRR